LQTINGESKLTAISSLIFYIAARQIQADILSRIRELKAVFDSKFERQQIALSSRFQKYIDRNWARITNIEARLEYFESAFESLNYTKFVETLDSGLPEKHTDL
jgi:hypothetical protein